MHNKGILNLTRTTALMTALLILGGCSWFGSKPAPGTVAGWSNAPEPPSGYVFSNGFPPSSEGPSPEWFAKRFSRARGLGEAIKKNRRSIWDSDDSTFVFYMGSVLAAHYHPWEHYLEIVTQKKGENNTICHWKQNGALSIGTTNKSPPPAGSEDTCKQLMNELARHLAPHSKILLGGA